MSPRSEPPVAYVLTPGLNLSGETRGMLRVLSRPYRRGPARRLHYLCECQCGKLVIVRRDKLVSGRQVSCGCWRDSGGSFITASLRGKMPSKEQRVANARKGGLAAAAKRREAEAGRPETSMQQEEK